MSKFFITTSWDDANKLDLKLVKLLDKYNLPGTFYISPNYSGGEKTQTLSNEEIKKISEKYEIGAHTINHQDLTQLDLAQAKKEIDDSKKYIENILGKKINSFAYPFGQYNQEIKKIVKQAGFLNARTTQQLSIQPSSDVFETATTLQVYPFPLRKRNAQQYHLTRYLFQPLTNKFLKILLLKLPIKSFFSWFDLAQSLFDYTLKQGGVYHLWGHSAEIERYKMWEDLEKLFKYIYEKRYAR